MKKQQTLAIYYDDTTVHLTVQGLIDVLLDVKENYGDMPIRMWTAGGWTDYVDPISVTRDRQGYDETDPGDLFLTIPVP